MKSRRESLPVLTSATRPRSACSFMVKTPQKICPVLVRQPAFWRRRLGRVCRKENRLRREGQRGGGRGGGYVRRRWTTPGGGRTYIRSQAEPRCRDLLRITHAGNSHAPSGSPSIQLASL